MIAPDATTFAYLKGRPFAPQGEAWDQAVERWRDLASDPGAAFDREVTLDVSEIAPMVTWGNSPEDALAITGRVPDPATAPNAERREAMLRAIRYMGLEPGQALTDLKIDRAFIGSCTNGRIEDLESAAAVVRGRKVAAGVEAWVVPGSTPVKREAEARGLDRVFKEAGFQWREAGCSMCLGTNGDVVAAGQRCASSTNRNFVGRQGPGSRTHLMSPAMVAAAAVSGRLADVRRAAGGPMTHGAIQLVARSRIAHRPAQLRYRPDSSRALSAETARARISASSCFAICDIAAMGARIRISC